MSCWCSKRETGLQLSAPLCLSGFATMITSFMESTESIICSCIFQKPLCSTAADSSVPLQKSLGKSFRPGLLLRFSIHWSKLSLLHSDMLSLLHALQGIWQFFCATDPVYENRRETLFIVMKSAVTAPLPFLTLQSDSVTSSCSLDPFTDLVNVPLSASLVFYCFSIFTHLFPL